MNQARILIVEDEALVAEGIRSGLTELGYTIVGIVASGEEAIREVEEKRPDLVLMDIELQGEMDGIEAVERIHARCDVPVIYLTSYSQETIVERARVTAPFGYIFKPLRMRELYTSIEMALYKHAADRELRCAEEKYSALVENSPDVIMRFDREGRHLFVNRSVEQFVPLKADDFIGKTHRELGFPDEQAGLWEENIRTVFDSGRPVETEFTFESLRGPVIFNWRLLPELDEAGRVSSVLSIARDVTAWRRAEEALRDARDELERRVEERTIELRESEEKYRNLVELARDGIVIIQDAAIVYANSAAAEIAGRSVEALLGAPMTDFLDPEEQSRVMEHYRRRMAGENVPSVYTTVIRNGDGCEVPVEVNARRIMYRGRSADLAVLRDITERVRAEEMRRQMEARLVTSQKLSSLGTLAAGIAHEINSPLQVITGVSRILLERLDEGAVEPAYLRRQLDMISRNAWRCADIVRALSAYARTSDQHRGPHDLNALIRDTLLLIEHQLKSWANIYIVTELAADIPPLPCNRNQIAQVLINLLTNARDAMPNGGNIIIRTGYDPQVRSILLQVSDAGIGIPKELMDKIFDPFFTTKPVGQGTGLGLFIVYNIVQAHGGRLEVASTPGTGTTFTIFLPENPLPEDAPTAAAGSGRFV